MSFKKHSLKRKSLQRGNLPIYSPCLDHSQGEGSFRVLDAALCWLLWDPAAALFVFEHFGSTCRAQGPGTNWASQQTPLNKREGAVLKQLHELFLGGAEEGSHRCERLRRALQSFVLSSGVQQKSPERAMGLRKSHPASRGLRFLPVHPPTSKHAPTSISADFVICSESPVQPQRTLPSPRSPSGGWHPRSPPQRSGSSSAASRLDLPRPAISKPVLGSPLQALRTCGPREVASSLSFLSFQHILHGAVRVTKPRSSSVWQNFLRRRKRSVSVPNGTAATSRVRLAST